MMIAIKILLLLGSLLLVIRGAMLATKYAWHLAEWLRFSKYIIGLIVVSIISILPETMVSIDSVLQGEPEFWLATLFWSNIADLTLVFAIILLFSGRKNIKVERKILKNNKVYPFFFLIPILLWLDGYYGRLEWIALIIAGLIFYYLAFRNSDKEKVSLPREKRWSLIKNTIFLLISLAALLVWAHFTVTTWTWLANLFGIPPFLIGILIVGIWTTIPELFFSFNAVKKYNDGLAIGDILGTVLADATIVVGIVALSSPFSFPSKIVFITWLFMLGSTYLLTYFMRTGKLLSKKEWFILLAIWIISVVTEFLVNK